eukprot:gene1099-1395_t
MDMMNQLKHHIYLGKILYGQVISQCLKVAVNHDIAKRLKDGPKSVFDLAKEVNVDPHNLYRVIRALTSMGIFKEEEDDYVFSNSEISKVMYENEGWNDLLKLKCTDLFGSSWNTLPQVVATGEICCLEGKKNVYELMESKPEVKHLFHKAMSTFNILQIIPIITDCDFNQFETIVDVGGSEGQLLLSILEMNKSISKAINFDLDNVIKTNQTLDRSMYSPESIEKLQEVSGNFFHSVPAGGDLYILKNILHNWSDQQCITILQNIGKELKPSSKIYVFETLINTKNAPQESILFDLDMLCIFNGKERTVKEMNELAKKSGLKLESVTLLSNNLYSRIIFTKD